ncbi:MAG TPA: hypothetical protein VFN75_11565 [Pseudonocardiaceae bacterium]|nr:hypothetical protein [Pseudonocardiaceae bacterium]
MNWYLRSLRDADTHRGRMDPTGAVEALCGAVFVPRPTLRVVGPGPGRLVDGPPALTGNPPDPGQVCPQCREHES